MLVDSAAFQEHNAVDVDDEGGARSAAEHLLALGHRDFLVIGVEPPPPGSKADFGGVLGRRLAGFRAALEDAGVAFPDDRVVVGPASVDGGAACFSRTWEDGLRPTAVLAMSDVMAIGAIRDACRRGLVVPDDLSVVGFDDLSVARWVGPPLTTIRQPLVQMAVTAARLVLALARGEHPAQTRVELTTELVVRESTAPPRPEPRPTA